MTRPLKIGVNLTFAFGTENAFMDKSKTASTYGGNINGGGRNGANLQFNLDANGYPISMLVCAAGVPTSGFYDEIDFVVMQGSGTASFRSGHWVFLWTGTMTASDIVLSKNNGVPSGTVYTIIDSSHPNRIVFDTTSAPPDSTGMRIKLTNIAAGSLTSMSLVYGDVINAGDVQATAGTGGSTTAGVNGTGTYEASFNGGEVVDPDWFRLFGGFQGYRFMDWCQTNTNISLGYPLVDPAYYSWNPVPIEVQVYFCNKANASGWFNIPALITNAAVTNMATRVLSGHTDNGVVPRNWPALNSNLNMYVEFYNEFFNASLFTPEPYNTQISRGGLLLPSYSTDASKANGYFFIRTVQAENIWKDVFGGSSRVIRVQGSQDYDDGTFTQLTLPTDGGGYTFTSTGSSITGTTLTIGTLTAGTIVDEATYGAGHLVQGTNVLSQTYIISNISGSGNGSTWTVSKSHSATGSQSISGSYWPVGTTNGSLTDTAGQASYATSQVSPPSDLNDLFTKLYLWTGVFSITGSISGTTLTVTNSSGLRLSANQLIESGVAAGTRIVRQLTKAGGAWSVEGTYEVSISQTVASSSLGIIWGGMYDVLGAVTGGSSAYLHSFNKTLVNYEGGYGDTSADSGFQSLMLQAKQDPRMYTMYTQMLTSLEDMGCTIFFQFNDIWGSVYNFGVWGSIDTPLNHYGDASAQQYNALVDFMNSGTSNYSWLGGRSR